MGGISAVGKGVCPAIAVVAGVLFLWAPWVVMKTDNDYLALEVNIVLAEMISNAIPSSVAFWATAIGFLVVILGAIQEMNYTRTFYMVGGLLILVYPCRTLWSIYRLRSDVGWVSPGWGLAAVLVLGGLIIFLAPRTLGIQEATSE